MCRPHSAPCPPPPVCLLRLAGDGQRPSRHHVRGLRQAQDSQGTSARDARSERTLPRSASVSEREAASLRLNQWAPWLSRQLRLCDGATERTVRSLSLACCRDSAALVRVLDCSAVPRSDCCREGRARGRERARVSESRDACCRARRAPPRRRTLPLRSKLRLTRSTRQPTTRRQAESSTALPAPTSHAQ